MAEMLAGLRLAALRRRMIDDSGQAMIEYALIISMIALITIGSLQALGVSVSGFLGGVSNSLSSVLNS